MNSPQLMFVGCEDDGSNMIVVEVPKPAGTRLADYMLPRIETAAPSFGELFYCNLLSDSMSIIDIPQEYYSAVCRLIMEACDKHPELKSYKPKLKATLEADPCFKQAA